MDGVTPVPRVLPLLAIGTTLLFWASAFVAIRHLGQDVGAGAMSLGRLLVGSLALGAFLAVRRTAWRRLRREDWAPVLVIGLLWFGVYNVALNEAERRIDAGTASMLINVGPALIAVLAVLFLDERLHVFLAVGVALAFGGVALIGFATSSAQSRDAVGVLLCLTAAVAYSISVIVQKPLLTRVSPLMLTWLACTIGAVACLPWAGELVSDLAAAPVSSAGWLVYLGLFPTAVAFTTWAYALSHSDAGRLGVTTYLVPPVTVLMGWLLLDEIPPLLAFGGGALCLVGVAVARRGPGRPASTPVPPAPQPPSDDPARPGSNTDDSAGVSR